VTGAGGSAGKRAADKTAGAAGAEENGESAGAGEGGKGEGGAGTAGMGEGGAPSHVRFCGRLATPVGLASTVAVDFDFATAADCRVAGIPFLYVLPSGNQRADFLNQLSTFNYALWGCPDTEPPLDFALIYEEGLSSDPRPITTADLDALIEDYLAVAKPRLSLSQSELADLDAALRALAEGVTSTESTAYSRNNCDAAAGAAGAAGDAGGAGAGGGGAGGEGGA
jgi:hypothetical protein